MPLPNAKQDTPASSTEVPIEYPQCYQRRLLILISGCSGYSRFHNRTGSSLLTCTTNWCLVCSFVPAVVGYPSAADAADDDFPSVMIWVRTSS
jgi:hypothetical protein